jgi:hypothetical protein
MEATDAQHQAVRDAAARLKGERYWTRQPAAQREYLDDVGDLAREVAFILDQAGITWDQITAALDGSSGATADLLDRMREGSGQGVTELALGRAVLAAREALDG